MIDWLVGAAVVAFIVLFFVVMIVSAFWEANEESKIMAAEIKRMESWNNYLKNKIERDFG